MDNNIDEIKNRIDIVEYIGNFVQLKKAGRNFKSPCPFHQEKTPSFVVSPDRQMWHCFGSCGEGGDVIKFVMKWENITFYEALKELAERVGVKLDNVPFQDNEWNQKEKILKMNYLASEFYQYILHSTSFGAKANEYLKGRGTNEKIVKTFGIGYAPSSWDSLLKFLKKKGYPEVDMVEAGLIIQNEQGRFYDRFRGRLMFPLKDVKNNIIGFSGRLLESNDQAAKYVNTPETPIYHKRESLFGIQLARDAIKKAGNAILVEGEFDMITPYQHSIENVVGVKGAALTKEQLQLLKRYTTKITLAFDGDEAGEEAIRRGIYEAEKQEFEIYVARFPVGKDPDEAIKKDLIGFKKAIHSPLPIYDFLIDLAQKKHPGVSPFDKQNMGNDLIPMLLGIRNPIVQSYYIKKIATLLEVSEDSINKLMYRQRQIKKAPRMYPSRNKSELDHMSRLEMMQKYVLSFMFQSETPYEVSNQIFAVLQPEDFSIPALQKISHLFLDYQKQHAVFNMKEFCKTLPAEIQSVCDEVYLFASSDLEVAQANLTRLIQETKRSILKNRIGTLLKQTDITDAEKDEKMTTLTNMLKEVEKMLSTV